MQLLPVADALDLVLGGVEPLGNERVPLMQAAGRTLAEPLLALRTQPPFAASAMDGYAVRAGDIASVPAELALIGVSAAGAGCPREVGLAEAVRIFTGAPVPRGADTVVTQENCHAEQGLVRVLEGAAQGAFVRPAGVDFTTGEALLGAGRRLDPRAIGLAASMGHADLSVHERPRVGILATGDELVRPGEPAGPDQIVVSNSYVLAAMLTGEGCEVVDLGIARDERGALLGDIARARAQNLDVLVTIGGASVGEHDLVREALSVEGMTLAFWRIAMRPGKPLLHGRLDRMRVVGLPGNPVSSYVCAMLFLVPLIRALQGDARARTSPEEPALLGRALKANDGRQDYLRAGLDRGTDGQLIALPFERQDSSLTRLLTEADALLVRAPHAPAAEAGEPCRVIRLPRYW